MVKDCPVKGNGKGRSTEVHLGSSESAVEYLSLQQFEAMEQLFFTWINNVDELSEIEAYGSGLYAYYLEYLHQHAEGAVPLTHLDVGTLGNEPLSFTDWMFGHPGNIHYWGESDDDDDQDRCVL